MVGEDILQGIQNVDSEIVTAVEVAEWVRVGADIVAGVGAEDASVVGVGAETVSVDEAEADTVVVGVHYEIANVVGEGYTEVVIVVVEGYIDDVEVGIAIVQTGAGTSPVGLVDDEELVRIHNAYVIVEVRLGLGVGIGIDKSVAEAGFEILNSTEVEPKGQHNCCTTNFPDMFGKHKKSLLFGMKQVSDACLG